ANAQEAMAMKTSRIITAAGRGRRRGDANRGVVPGWPVRAGLPAAAAHQRNTVMTATPMSDEALATAMADLRGRLRARGLSVRATEKWGHNQRCNTNNAMFAARAWTARTSFATPISPPICA